MPSLEEQLVDHFYRWELRGRGWFVFDRTVPIEPPFRPFHGHFLRPAEPIDDGRRPTILSNFLRKLSGNAVLPPVVEAEDEETPLPALEHRPPPAELQTFLPANLTADRETFEQFLLATAAYREQLSFEIIALAPRLIVQFAAHQGDAFHMRSQLETLFPDVVFRPMMATLEEGWLRPEGLRLQIVEFGLEREFMLPLHTVRAEIALGIAAALADLEPEEMGVFQVLFQPVTRGWAESTLAAVTDGSGGSFFVNAPELLPATKRKLSRPLFSTVVRVGACSASTKRTNDIINRIAAALEPLSDPTSNRLVPLSNDGYPIVEHSLDLLLRQTRRPGMILNIDELMALVRLPSPAIRTDRLQRQTTRSKRAPQSLLGGTGLSLGENHHAGRGGFVHLSIEERLRHMHIIGASGTGKSTLLLNLIREGIETGEGLAVLDPHGDLIDRLLGLIPQERIKDVVLIDPSDEEYAVGFNVLSAHSEIEKTLLASDLISVFERLSKSWGDQMGSVLRNAILAFLESTEGGTLADVRRFLLEPDFRARFLTTVRDPDIQYYWQRGFSQLSGGKSIGPILTRLETFLSPKPIRYMVSQRENRIDFASIMDQGKILLAKLSQGAIGKENSYLLGTLLVSKFQQLAMSRQGKSARERRPFFIVIDEFHDFITPSMAEILSGARKYGLGLVLAHQELHQLERDREVMSAVLSNPGVRVCFRVGDRDAKVLEDGFSYFEARDLQNLNRGEAIVRVERADQDFNITVPLLPEPSTDEASERRAAVIAASRATYGKPRTQVEQALAKSAPAPTSAPPEPPTAPPAALVSPPPVPSLTPPPQSVSPAPVAPVEPAAAERRTPPAYQTSGRGGAQHKYLQHLIRQLAIGMNFEVDVEQKVEGGEGSADVEVRKGGKRFCFEVSVNTPATHDVAIIGKRLSAGYDAIVVVCPESSRLSTLKSAALAAFDSDKAACLRFCMPDDLSQTLVEFSALSLARGGVSHGRKTNVNFKALSKEEAQKRREAIAEVSAQSLRRMKRKDV